MPSIRCQLRYSQVLRGVLVSHSNTTFLTQSAPLLADCPYLVCKVSFDATVWSPQIGMRLGEWILSLQKYFISTVAVGKVNLCSPDHIALLLHRTFNVSIPRHHIPMDSWQFEHGPAENDPEYGSHIPGSEENEMGRWRHRITGDLLGGNDGHLKFTVIGYDSVCAVMLTVNNQKNDSGKRDAVIVWIIAFRPILACSWDGWCESSGRRCWGSRWMK